MAFSGTGFSQAPETSPGAGKTNLSAQEQSSQVAKPNQGQPAGSVDLNATNGNAAQSKPMSEVYKKSAPANATEASGQRQIQGVDARTQAPATQNVSGTANAVPSTQSQAANTREPSIAQPGDGKTAISGSTVTWVSKSMSQDMNGSPDTAVEMFFSGLDKASAEKIEALSIAAGFKSVKVDYATGSVKVVGSSSLVKEETVKAWVKQNFYSSPNTH